MKRKILLLTLAALLLTCSAAWAAISHEYRFDDVYGPSGIGGQWIAVLTDGSTIGAPLTTTMLTEGDFVNDRDSAYILNGLTAGEAIESVFLVIPGASGTLNVDFDWMTTNPGGEAYTQDLTLDLNDYSVIKDPLGALSPWDFRLQKSSGTSIYETVRGNMMFHQNPSGLPSQTLQVPLLIANVREGTAEANPLLFRSALRDSGMGQDIVAYDRFTWNVLGDKSVGGGNSDWVFVPVEHAVVDSNNINYYLSTEVTNYTGIRYGFQRYDTGLWSWMYPTSWKMDVPAGNGDVTAKIYLDELSHMPPGLITTYENKPFNVVTATGAIFHMYPIDPASGFRNLSISYPTLFGLDLGTERSDSTPYYTVTGFSLIAADPNFIKTAASVAGIGELEMVDENDAIMSGITSAGYVGADAINTLAVDAIVPSRKTGSDKTALLPLHITFNLPKSNRYVAQKWDAFLTEWRRSGNIRSLFSNSFTLYMQNSEGNRQDLFSWLKGKGAFESNVKVFLDESKECITVSFIAMLADSGARKIGLAEDKSVNSSYSYLIVTDGLKDDRIALTFFTTPAGSSSGGSEGSGGGGGCSGAAPASVLAIICAAALALKNVRGSNRGGK